MGSLAIRTVTRYQAAENEEETESCISGKEMTVKNLMRRAWGFIVSVTRGRITHTEASRLANGTGPRSRDDKDWRFRG